MKLSNINNQSNRREQTKIKWGIYLNTILLLFSIRLTQKEKHTL